MNLRLTSENHRWRCSWLFLVSFVVGLSVSRVSASLDHSSTLDERNLWRLHRIRTSLTELEALVDEMENSIEADSTDRSLRHPTLFTTEDKRQTMKGFSAARGKRFDDVDNIGSEKTLRMRDYDYYPELVDMRRSLKDVNAEYYPSEEVKRSQPGYDVWSQVLDSASRRDSGPSAFFYDKRYPASGFSPVRGKRPSYDVNDLAYVSAPVTDAFYKRAPPRGFSSARGKRYDVIGGKRAPPGGFSSVRGKRERYGNPFLRLLVLEDEEPPKRTPPSGFSFSRGKKEAGKAAVDPYQNLPDSVDSEPRQALYGRMLKRLLTGIPN